MSHIHIALVGAQPMPAYIGVKYSIPDKVIFICSTKTRTEAERVQREVSCPSEIQELDPVELPSIAALVKSLAEYLSKDEVSVNISGGTKPWTYYFIENFGRQPGADIFYVDQNNTIWNFTNQTQHMANFYVDMDVLFKLYGNLPQQYRVLNRYTREDIESIERIRNLRKFNFKEFTMLSHNFTKNEYLKRQTAMGSTLEWIEKDQKFIFRLYNRRGESKLEIFDSPNIREILLDAGWFEIEVALLLNKWDKANEIRLNCVFPAKDSTPKNQIDIIVNTGAKLLFVECKTQIYSITDIDKFRSATNNYGGTGSKTLMITDALMNSRALEKCNDNNVLPFSIEENGGIKTCQKTLFALLDKELYNINPK